MIGLPNFSNNSNNVEVKNRSIIGGWDWAKKSLYHGFFDVWAIFIRNYWWEDEHSTRRSERDNNVQLWGLCLSLIRNSEQWWWFPDLLSRTRDSAKAEVRRENVGGMRGNHFTFINKDNFDFLYGRQNTLGLAYKEEFNTQKYARSSRLLAVTELFNILVYEDNIR